MKFFLLRPRLVLIVAGIIFSLSFAERLSAQVLFDNTKAEVAGNADWIIDVNQPIPSPSITNITSSTPETYWNGALSSWGVALAKLSNAGLISLPGYGLETLPVGGAITYNNPTNTLDLSHFKVYVVCEPNILFTAAEKSAILNFVNNGGGLFMVADHSGSDRNNDGYDSLQIWNDLLTNNSVQINPFGFTFNSDNSTPTATVDTSPADPLINGLAGTVTTLQYDDGCTMNLNNTNVVHAAVWESNPSQVMALYGTFGTGRFVAIGDSSVVEDATSSSGTTYAGWTTPVDNGYCVINGMVWLLGSSTNGSNQLPTVATLAATTVTTNSATLNGSLNPNSQAATAQFEYGTTTNYGSVVSIPGNFIGTDYTNVSTNLSNLTPGTTYHFRLDATNASGMAYGNDQSFVTTAISVGNYSGILAGWDVSTLSGYGASPLTSTTNAPNLTVIGLTRGSGVGTNGTAAARAWGGTTWNSTSSAAAITASEFVTLALVASSGYQVSFNSISEFDYRRSSTGAASGLVQYAIGNGAFTDITNVSYSVNTSTGGSLGPIDLTGIAALQNVPAGSNITFRIVNWGATAAGGTWYVFDVNKSTAPDFAIQGSVTATTSNPVSQPSLTIKSLTNGVVITANTGAPTSTYTLQIATNLNPPVTWASILTNLTDGNGQISYTDTNVNRPATYYRVVLP